MKKVFFSLIFLTSYFLAFSQMPMDSLKAYYPFNGNANDESGNENHGTVIGATLTTDRFGNENSAYVFDGDNDMIELPTDFDYENRTICTWFNADIISLYNRIISIDHPDLQYGSSKIQVNNINAKDKLQMVKWIANEQFQYNIAEDQWYFASFVVEGNKIKYFVNGLLVDSVTSSYQTSVSGQPNAFIGVSRTGESRFFDGIIDDVRVYNKALTEKEILHLYTEGYDFLYNFDTVTITETVFDTTIIYDTTTIYNIDTLTVYDSIAVTDTLMVDVSLIGFEEPNNINRIKVFPNPAHEILTINTGEYQNMEGYSLRITNNQAQTVFETMINEQEFQINVNDFGAEGLYFLRIINPNQEIIELRKIILL